MNPHRTYHSFTAPQRQMLQKLDDKYVRAPFSNSWWMGFGYVCVAKRGEQLLVSDIWVEARYRGRGHGAKMLKELIKLADLCKVPLFIYARPFDSKPTQGDGMRKRDLDEWYKRLGFKERPGVYMIREPQS